MGAIESGQVNIGGRPHVVARFKTYKAVLVGEILAKVTKEVRAIVKEAAAFRREYRDENVDRITRQMCHEAIAELTARAADLRKRAQDAPEERTAEERERADGLEAKLRAMLEDESTKAGDAELLKLNDELRSLRETKATLEGEVSGVEARIATWEAQLTDLGDRAYVEIPRDPSDNEVLVAVFPRAFESRKQLAELLALLVTPDSDLKERWRHDEVHAYLEEKGNDLIEESEPEDMVNLALAAKAVVGDQFRPLARPVRKLTSSWKESMQEEPSTEETTPSTPTLPSPTSSTDSPQPTDGDSNPSGSRSPTEQPSPAPVA